MNKPCEWCDTREDSDGHDVGPALPGTQRKGSCYVCDPCWYGKDDEYRGKVIGEIKRT